MRDPDRADSSVASLRHHAARGSVINSLFNLGMFGLGNAQRFLMAIWLTRSQYGIWGILIGALFALTFIKTFGIADKYIQQSEPDQELAYHKAFTIELVLSVAFFLLACGALPLYAMAYSRPELIMPGIVLALTMPITSFEAPVWIAYRRMQYGHQRLLGAVDPVVSMVSIITLVATGLGYWGIVYGSIIGSVVGAVVCTLASPYRLRLAFDWATVKSYATFSLPLFGYGICGFFTLQGTLLAANRAVGLAGIGVIALAGNITGLSDGVDNIVSQTIYPAVCAVAHRREVLAEAFVKSNRVALMWGMPAMVGAALFSWDIIHFIFGARWQAAAPIVAALALSCGLAQVAFNWGLFLRAVNHTSPIFFAAVAQAVVTLTVSIPMILLFGLTGYAIGFAVVTASQVLLRGYYMRKLFGSFSVLRQLVRSVLPTVPGVAAVLALRVLTPGTPSLVGALAEVLLYGAVVVAATYVLERPLVRELAGYLGKIKASRVKAAVAASPAPVA